MTPLARLAARFGAQRPTAHLHPLNAAVAIAGRGIVPCRDAPLFVADRRSLKAGLAIYGAVALVLGIIVLIAWGYLGAGKP